MTGSGRHPDDDDALWQQVTRGVTPYEQPARKLANSGNGDLPRKKPKKATKIPPARMLASTVPDAPTMPRPIDVAAALSVRPGPVSYTHLRAHETDSYLVWRLLLE